MPVPGSGLLKFIMYFVVLLLCAGVTFWPLSDKTGGFVPELLGQARLYFTLGYVVVLFFLLWRKAWFSSLIMAALVVFNVYWIYTSFHIVEKRYVEDKADPKLRVMSFNIYVDNPIPDDISRSLARVDPDILFLTEVEGPLVQKMIDQFSGRYPFYVAGKHGNDRLSVALFSKYPFTSEYRKVMEGSWQKVLYADIEAHGQVTQFFGIHPVSPKSTERTIARNLQFQRLARHIVLYTNPNEPLIVAGDFNTSPWQHGMRDLQHITGLANVDTFGNMTLTWPTWLPEPFGVPIDHILHNSRLCSGEKQRHDYTGSDHYPVWVDIYFCDGKKLH